MFVSSVKDINNLPTAIPETNAYTKFMSQKNRAELASIIYRAYIEKGGDAPYLKFREDVFARMRPWAIKHDINKFRSIHPHEQLLYINNLFINDMIVSLHIGKKVESIRNEVYGKVYLGQTDDFGDLIYESKKREDLLAHEYGMLDFGEPAPAFTSSSVMLRNNAIPMDRITRHVRNYDRSNEGYRVGDPDLASRTNLVRGYNMETIYDIADQI